ncbi:MAG: prepilin-type N-terminal cleavage/methylation domain-containing protein [Phycisphaerae bacterium]|nr:prepilin-type N-terminal cleavage/methylation domain-containing protein [Phycisphaerae bacterium]
MVKRHRARRHGFNLLELLVVVALITLLLSTLLPSLSVVRAQATATVCLSNLKNLGNAQHGYQTVENGYIPGSPLTSGYPLAHVGSAPPAEAGTWRIGMPLNTFDYATPLLQHMNIALPRGGTPADVRRRCFPITTAEPFHCPANRQVAEAWAPSGVPADYRTLMIRAPSYLTMNTMMRGGPAMYDRYTNGSLALVAGVLPWDMAQPTADQYAQTIVDVPAGYFPRIERVGRAAMKVFLADGTRFVDSASQQITYNIRTADFAGYHSAEPPCDYRNGTPNEYVRGKAFAYRHGRGTVINALMFDGHAEPLRAEWGSPGQATGPAVDPKHYFPTGSVVRGHDKLFLRDVYRPGAVLP